MEESGDLGVLEQQSGNQNIKRLLLKKTRHLKLINLVFSMYGKMEGSEFIVTVPLICNSAI